MARIVRAFASSHSVMLTARLEDWQYRFPEVDPKNPHYFDKQGNACTYEDLLAIAPKDSAAMVTPEKMAERYHAAEAAIAEVKRRVQAQKLDCLIVVGDDQTELFHHDNMPGIAIYYGKTIRNAKRVVPDKTPWFRLAQLQRLEPDDDVHYPVDGDLAEYLIRQLCDRQFDIAAVRGLKPEQFEGHAFSFVHRKFLQGGVVPIVPIFLNTFDPPNQPTPKRCIALGQALRELIATYPKDMRVGLFASGGLSHFVVDETLDRAIIEGVRKGDYGFLAGLNPRQLQAGTSEIRNWLVVAEAARDLKLGWTAYVPGYRTPALTGTGLGFAEWE